MQPEGVTIMAEPTQVVVSSEAGLAQEIVSGNHRWHADEPAPFGTDTGPSPYELLLASLGACTSMTLRLYAQRKGMDLQRIIVRLQHYRIHAEDCRRTMMRCRSIPFLCAYRRKVIDRKSTRLNSSHTVIS